MIGHAIKVPQLIHPHPKRDPDLRIQPSCRETMDQEIQLGLAPQTPEDDLLRQSGIAGCHPHGRLAKKIGGKAATLDPPQHVKSDLARSIHRHSSNYTRYNGRLDLEKTLLRKVGEAIGRFQMIRDGDRVAVALSGGKDSVTLLEALLLLAKRAPIQFTVCAFTIEQGKFLRPIQPLGEWLKLRGIDWTYFHDAPSHHLLEEQPDHGCDLCSRYRRRAVYEVVSGLHANVIAFGHTADDFCESFFRNAMFTGRLSALPPVTLSKDGQFRLIRPLCFVTEDITRQYADSLQAPVIPCGCSQKTGTVRNSLRDIFAGLEQQYPNLKQNILSALGNLQPDRLLDPRFHHLSLGAEQSEDLLQILTEP